MHICIGYTKDTRFKGEEKDMKGFKKLLTGILAATMIMGASITAFATDNSASITITPQDTNNGGEVQEITYTYYQILRASIGDGEKITYYLNNNEKEAALKELLVNATNAQFTATLSADGSRYTMTSELGADDGDIMRDAINTPAIKAAAISTSTFEYDKKTGKAYVGDLEPGYYLIVSSLGSVVALDTRGNEAIVEKNTYITTDKTVAKTNYNIGDEVEYTATVYIPASTEEGSNVVLHDKMNSVLEFNNDAAAKIGEEAFTGFTVATAGLEDTCTFEITIPVTKDVLNKTITFTYSATLTQAAAGKDGFVNELFGENNGYKTTPKMPVVYSFDFDLLKTFAGSNGNEGYTAKFEVRTAAGDENTAIYFVKNGDKDYKKAETTTAEGASKEVTVTQGVTSNFYGLAEGTYYLVETETDAPGYNILAKAVAVTIADDGTVTYTVSGQDGSSQGVVTIANTSGNLLPSTGGVGTTIFYILGGILIIAGVAYFLVKRKAVTE